MPRACCSQFYGSAVKYMFTVFLLTGSVLRISQYKRKQNSTSIKASDHGKTSGSRQELVRGRSTKDSVSFALSFHVCVYNSVTLRVYACISRRRRKRTCTRSHGKVPFLCTGNGKTPEERNGKDQRKGYSITVRSGLVSSLSDTYILRHPSTASIRHF